MNFLQQYGPSPITTEEATVLDNPISIEETLAALKQLKTGKTPGPDGLTVSYYKSFTEILIPHFTKAFNSLPTSPQANTDILEAHITLIPKPGKDTTMVYNYRPISLLNVDVKLYAKVIAYRLLPLTPQVDLTRSGWIHLLIFTTGYPLLPNRVFSYPSTRRRLLTEWLGTT